MSIRKTNKRSGARPPSKKRRQDDGGRPFIKKDYPDRNRDEQVDIKIGDVFTAQVKDLASDGRGVLEHPGGRTVFVPGVWVEEEVEVKVTGQKGRVAFAELVQVIQPSVHRLDSPCPHHGIKTGDCGGCPWLFVDYQAQLLQKQSRVEKSFLRLNVADVIKPIIASPKSLGYRNRAQFKTDGNQLGFMAAQTNQLVNIDDCIILSDKNRDSFKQLKKSLPNKDWAPRKKNTFTTLDIDETLNASEVSVNQRLPFMQANTDQNSAMKNWLSQHFKKVPEGADVLELFCGAGNFTEVLAGANVGTITAVEGSEASLAQLNEKALPKVNALLKNLFDESEFNQTLFQAKDASVLVLDPPRDGLKQVGNLFAKKSKIKHVFYISCDLATLTRDLALFTENKFKIKEVQPIDQFPNTPHIECLVYLKRS